MEQPERPFRHEESQADTLEKGKVILCTKIRLWYARTAGNEFVFTAGEQEFYAERGFTNEPKRCKACRDAKRGGAPRQEREMFTAVCDSCGGEARVPFQPREGRPIYCSACYAKMKEEA